MGVPIITLHHKLEMYNKSMASKTIESSSNPLALTVPKWPIRYEMLSFVIPKCNKI